MFAKVNIYLGRISIFSSYIKIKKSIFVSVCIFLNKKVSYNFLFCFVFYLYLYFFFLFPFLLSFIFLFSSFFLFIEGCCALTKNGCCAPIQGCCAPIQGCCAPIKNKERLLCVYKKRASASIQNFVFVLNKNVFYKNR